MIVVDASVVVSGLLQAGEARDAMGREALSAPHLVDAEVIHVLRRRVAAQHVSVAEAQRALGAWRRMGIRRYGAQAYLGRIWELRENLSAYDATYVGLAEVLDCPLLTADGRLSRAPGPRCTVTLVAS